MLYVRVPGVGVVSHVTDSHQTGELVNLVGVDNMSQG